MSVMEPAIQLDEDPYRGATIVLYDGVCAMCNGVVRFLLKHDRHDRILFAALQDSFARDVLTRQGKSPDDLDTVAVVVDHGLSTERIFVRSNAFVYLLQEMGGVWKPLGVLLGLFPVAVLDRVYGLIVRNRYELFGRYDTCPLPPPEIRARFVPPDTSGK